MATLHLIDTSGYIYRAYFVIRGGKDSPGLIDPEGNHVEGLYGFMKMTLALLRERIAPGAYIASVFDGHKRGEDHRSVLDPTYKANRKPVDPDLAAQFPMVWKAAEALGVNPVKAPGFEADDTIASYVHAARAEGFDVEVISPDKDLSPLLCQGATLWDPMKAAPIDEAAVLAKFGVAPALVPDVLALMGDSSDNIPGVPGIGVKTAANLINRYGSVEGAIANAESVTPARFGMLLTLHADQARRSRELVELKTDVPLPAPVASLAFTGHDTPALEAMIERHAFKSIAEDLGIAA
jgi:DNA polymerase-1